MCKKHMCMIKWVYIMINYNENENNEKEIT